MPWTMRFKIVWICGCWSYIWPTFWFVVCNINGSVGTIRTEVDNLDEKSFHKEPSLRNASLAVASTVTRPTGRKQSAQINSFIAVFILAGQLTLTVVTYFVTRPGSELLFTVVSLDEKYKAKVCIDVLVQRLEDATAAGLYKLLSAILMSKQLMWFTSVEVVVQNKFPVEELWILVPVIQKKKQ